MFTVHVQEHWGVQRTMQQIQKVFYWPGWRNDTSIFVTECAGCLHREKINLKDVIPHEDVLCIDLVGPISLSANKNKYILTLMDQFSRYVCAVALLNWIIDLMRNSDVVRIRRQFKLYSGLAQDMQPRDKVYAAMLPPPGNSRKLQIKWSGPLVTTEVVNKAMIKIQELHVKNPKTYIAHRSKLRLAKKMGQKDTDPLFRLLRLPKDEMDQINQELEEFELPGKSNQDVIDEFHQDFLRKFINLNRGMTARVHLAASQQEPELPRTG